MKQNFNIIKNQLSKIVTNDTLLVVAAGSRTTNSFTPKSDYDFFIITKLTNKVRVYKVDNVKFECFYYSLKRLSNCVKANDHIVIHVIATGRSVYSSSRKAKEIILQMKALNKFYKIKPNTLLKFQYRFEMIMDKLQSCDDKDENVIRWINIFALPYIVRFLFYFNHSVCPTIKRWPIDILKLSKLPSNFKYKFKIMLGIRQVSSEELKFILISVLNYIKKQIGAAPDHYEIILSENDTTTII